MDTTVTLDSIESRFDNAQTMRLITLQDLRSMGMAESEARQSANPDNLESVETQLDLLSGYEKHPKRRMGAYILGRSTPAGFSVLGDWSLGDELDYVSDNLSYKERFQLKSRIRRVIGMYSLVADRTLHGDVQHAVRSALLYDVVAYADAQEKEIRGSFYDEDPAADLYESHGFTLVQNRLGRPIGSVVQKLMMRPTKTA